MVELSQNPLQTQPSAEHKELRIPICKVFTNKLLIKRQKLKLHFTSGAGDESPGCVHLLRAARLPPIRDLGRSLHGGMRRARTPRSGQSSAASPRSPRASPSHGRSLGSAGAGPPGQPLPAAPEPGCAPRPERSPGPAHSPAPPDHGRVCRARGLRARGWSRFRGWALPAPPRLPPRTGPRTGAPRWEM